MSTDLDVVALQVEETPVVVLPLTGAVVDLHVPVDVAWALKDVRDAKRQLDEVRVLLESVLRLEAQRQGTKTLHLDGVDAVVGGGEKAEYDVELLQEQLRAAGLPESRLSEAIVETVSYKVNQLVLKHIAGANPEYAAAVETAKTLVETPWYVSVKPTRKRKGNDERDSD